MTQDEYNKKLIRWVRNHYWNSLENDKNLILRHLRTFIGDKEIYETITISKREYFHLRRALERYERLERANIERWNDFGKALNRNGNKLNIDDWEIQEQKRIENL